MIKEKQEWKLIDSSNKSGKTAVCSENLIRENNDQHLSYIGLMCQPKHDITDILLFYNKQHDLTLSNINRARKVHILFQRKAYMTNKMHAGLSYTSKVTPLKI